MPLVAKYNTWLQDEAAAYPNGGQTRKGVALFPDGKVRRVWAGIPDTWFSAPAHARVNGRYVAGWVSIDDGLVTCTHCGGEDWTECQHCGFGLMDSPTYGALIFHPNTQQEAAA